MFVCWIAHIDLTPQPPSLRGKGEKMGGEEEEVVF